MVPLVDDVFSSHEQEICHTTSLDKSCIEFEFQTDRMYYVDLRQTYLASKLEFVRDRGDETYSSKYTKKERKKTDRNVRGRDGVGGIGYSRYSCKQRFALVFFQC